MKKKYYIIIISVIILVILDQITKYVIANSMVLGEKIVIIEDFFLINSHRNSGGAWGILQDQMTIFYLVTIIAFVLFYYLTKEVDFKNKKIYSMAVVLLIAGGVGNFIDRLIFQEVVDFLDFYIFNYDFPIFNVADICLTVGISLFAFDILLEEVFNGKAKN